VIHKVSKAEIVKALEFEVEGEHNAQFVGEEGEGEVWSWVESEDEVLGDKDECLFDVNVGFDLDDVVDHHLWEGSVQVEVHHVEECDVSGIGGSYSRDKKKRDLGG